MPTMTMYLLEALLHSAWVVLGRGAVYRIGSCEQSQGIIMDG